MASLAVLALSEAWILTGGRDLVELGGGASERRAVRASAFRRSPPSSLEIFLRFLRLSGSALNGSQTPGVQGRCWRSAAGADASPAGPHNEKHSKKEKGTETTDASSDTACIPCMKGCARARVRERACAFVPACPCLRACVPVSACLHAPVLFCVPLCLRLSLCLCASVPLCLCAAVPLCRCAAVPLCRCASAPLCLRASVCGVLHCACSAAMLRFSFPAKFMSLTRSRS